MKKELMFYLLLFSILLFLISCAPVSQEELKSQAATQLQKVSDKELTILSPENFTLVGFWKIEHKFVIDEEKSTEENIVLVEVPVPRERYLGFKEGGENCLREEELQSLTPDQVPQITIMPSPALGGGYILSGVCYLLKDPDYNSTMAYGMLINGKDLGFKVGGIGTEQEAKELMNLYLFEDGKLKIFSRQFQQDNEDNVITSLTHKTILSPSTQAAAQADGWPYYNFN